MLVMCYFPISPNRWLSQGSDSALLLLMKTSASSPPRYGMIGRAVLIWTGVQTEALDMRQLSIRDVQSRVRDLAVEPSHSSQIRSRKEVRKQALIGRSRSATGP